MLKQRKLIGPITRVVNDAVHEPSLECERAKCGIGHFARPPNRFFHLPTIKPGTSLSFGPLKQIEAGVLNVGYVEAGPANGQAVMLLHGWPYDIHSYVEVAPLLAAAGYRVIVPYFPLRFLLSDIYCRSNT